MEAVKSRKKAWFQQKIDDLEAELARVENNGIMDNELADHCWADGFVACMHQFQIMNKAARQRIHQQLKEHGPRYARRIKGAKFRGVML